MADIETESASDTIDRLRLIRSAQIGPISYRHLLARFGTASAALAAIPDLATRGGGHAPRLATQDDVVREMAAVHALGARYLMLGTPDYPAALAEVENAPVAMTIRGRLELLDRPMIAMVGARNASAAACRFARDLAAELTRRGVTIVSGLARGIDTAAHDGSIAGGGTIGVIASGIDIAFPPENAGLQERIAIDQLLIAEQPPGTQPLARHFPYRNRIIAGLAAGTIVVEAAPRSGSLITARLAGEYGREVMAVPGSPIDPRAQGCNGLIREGATLIQSADDVIEAIGPIDARMARSRPAPFVDALAASEVESAERGVVQDLLGHAPVSIDELIRQAALAPALVQTVLLELELAGRLQRHAGGKVSLAR